MTDTPSPGATKLQAYAARIAKRHAEVEAAFGEAAYNPANNKDYLKFIKDMTAEVACKYVLAGVTDVLDETPVDPGVVDKKAEELRRKGFTVSGDPAVAAEVAGDASKATDPEGTKAAPDQLPDHSLSLPVVQHAMELGFDPNSDDEDFTTRGPNTPKPPSAGS